MSMIQIDIKYKYNKNKNKNVIPSKFITIHGMIVDLSLPIITMCRYDISDKSIRALVDALKVNTSVTTINFSENDVGDEGSSALADKIGRAHV